LVLVKGLGVSFGIPGERPPIQTELENRVVYGWATTRTELLMNQICGKVVSPVS
jgi:hypothetical protein